MAAPTPLPSALKRLRGNPGRRRLNEHEPQPRSARKCPEPPPWLTPYALERWREVAPELFALGLLTVADVGALAIHCSHYGRWRQAEEQIARMPELVATTERGRVADPLVAIAGRAAKDALSSGNEFGLTPSSRTRVRVDFIDEGKFAGLIA
jgi:P27 family predicted phage terminase small subunit